MLAGLIWPALGVAAALGLAVLLLGAVVSHLRAGDSLREISPALLLLAIDALYLTVAMPVDF